MSTLSFGASDAFDALVYADAHPATLNFLQNRLTQMSQQAVGAGRAFIARAQEAFNHYNGAAAMGFIRNVLQTVGGGVGTASPSVNRVVCLFELVQMQQASPMMQRFVMANPVVRDLYHRQRCDGYSDSYVDVHPGDIGEAHYDYRRVMDGIMQMDEKNEWYVRQYHERLPEEERPLFFTEKVDILCTWNAMDLIMALGKDDPTGQAGATL